MSELRQFGSEKVDYSALLLPYYQNDIWVWKEHPDYEKLKDFQKNYVKNLADDFTKCTNRRLREEMKFYGQCEIENGILALHSFHGHFEYMYKIFFFFMNAFHPEVDSILEMDEEVFEREMTKYWNDLGRSLVSAVKQIDASMNLKIYDKYRSGTLGKIIHIPRDLRKFLSAAPVQFRFEDDFWDIRLTPFRDKVAPYRPRYILAFNNIQQADIKKSAKHYIWHKLAVKAFSTCQDYLKGINLFSEFLSKEYPKINCLAEINREIIDNFLRYAKSMKRMTSFTSANRIGKVRDFFETCILLNLEDKPNCQLIMDSDYLCRKRPTPRFFTDDELKQFNMHIRDLPLDIARMLLTIEIVGMRVSELCTLETGCIQTDLGGETVLTYYMFKTKRFNRVPISDGLAQCLRAAIAETKEKFGLECRYVFTRDGIKPISIEIFNRALNELSYKFKFKDRAGKPLRVKSHTFRGTVATNYVNVGIDPNAIRMMMGQSDMKSLKFYIDISDEAVLESVKALLEQQDALIRNIGNPEALQQIIVEENVDYQALPNGLCAEKGKCEHFNACYSCPMFHPDSSFIQVYRYQLQKAETALAMAKANGMKRLEDINDRLVSNLKRIIRECES